jgi:hypothetical protein
MVEDNLGGTAVINYKAEESPPPGSCRLHTTLGIKLLALLDECPFP